MTQNTSLRKFLIPVCLVIIVGISLFLILGKKTDTVQPIRLGWQPPWVNQGQIVEVLKNSGITQKNNVEVKYIPFTYGGPMTEAALSGDLDIIFAGDQPAITLITKDPKWKIIARMINYRSAIIVPKNSSFTSLVNLKGKKIATAFGSTTHRDLIRELNNAGIDPKKDITLVNLDQAEHASVISAGGPDSWNGIDAIATYDPTIAIGVLKNNAKIVKEWLSPSVVVANENILKTREKDVIQFLKSYIEAFTIYESDQSKYNKLYSTDSRLELPDTIYRQMAKFEPNMTATSVADVSIIIDTEREQLHQTNADIALSIGIIKKSLTIKEHIDNSYIEKAKSSLR